MKANAPANAIKIKGEGVNKCQIQDVDIQEGVEKDEGRIGR